MESDNTNNPGSMDIVHAIQSISIALQSNNITLTSNRYKFSVYRNAAQNTAAGAWGKILLDTKNYDTNSNFDVVTNNRYVAPVTGYYQIQGQGFVNSGGALVGAVGIYKNGVLFRQGQQNMPQNAQPFGLVVSDLMFLTVGDYVELWWYSNVATGFIVGAGTIYMSGFLVTQN